MSSAFSSALSALNANSTAIDAVSGNLANLNTSGYKGTQVSFEDIVHQALGQSVNGNDVGGSTIARTTRQFVQGSLETTNGPFDAAIQGDGFFVIRGSNGEQLFTRAGNFKVTSSGQLVTADGHFVQGWNQTNGALNTTGPTGDIILPGNTIRAPLPSTQFSLGVNLNSNGVVGGTDGTFSSPVQVIDSQGNMHLLTVNFAKTAPSQWSYDVDIASADLTGGTGTTTSLAAGTLTFDAQGNLTSPAATSPTVPIAITGLANGAADMNLNWSLYDSSSKPLMTQYAQPSATLSTDRDGVQPAQLASINIGDNGTLFAHYSNGETSSIAQLALAAIRNPDSLQVVNGNNFGVTAKTAVPVIGMPGTGSRGAISGGALENSTVDIAQQFTKLLTFERGYQANSKVITTEDEIMQETVSLKR